PSLHLTSDPMVNNVASAIAASRVDVDLDPYPVDLDLTGPPAPVRARCRAPGGGSGPRAAAILAMLSPSWEPPTAHDERAAARAPGHRLLDHPGRRPGHRPAGRLRRRRGVGRTRRGEPVSHPVARGRLGVQPRQTERRPRPGPSGAPGR